MLYGDIQTALQAGTSPALADALAFLASAGSLADGRHDLSHGMYGEIRRYSPQLRDVRPYECHMKYLDIHAVLEGEEAILVRRRDGLSIREGFPPERDLAFLDDPADDSDTLSFLLRPGLFLLVRPEDAHKTECLTSVKAGRKVVVKVPATVLVGKE